MRSLHWRRLPDRRYEVGFSYGQDYEPVKRVTDIEPARWWVKAQKVRRSAITRVKKPSLKSDYYFSAMSDLVRERRFPPPWLVEELDACFAPMNRWELTPVGLRGVLVLLCPWLCLPAIQLRVPSYAN